MQTAFDRTISLIGEQAFDKLARSHVLVVGLGGVGGAAVEALARSGVGALTLMDGDMFEPTNLNRQILCTVADLGKNKAEVAALRVSNVNPSVKVTAIPRFLSADNIDGIFAATRFDYCIDAIDDLKNKVLLIAGCKRASVPVISAMGAGNRLDCGFAVTDVFQTKDDPFARKLRRELKAAGVAELDVVCATSPPYIKAGTPASIAAPPMVMGAMLAGYVVQRLAGL